MTGEQTRGRGVVIHVEERAVHVLTPWGEIHRVDPRQWRRPPAPGEEVTFPLAAVRRERRHSLLLGLAPLAAAAALFLALQVPALTAAATVAVEINPAVELTVSPRGTVVRAAAADAGGRTLLAAAPVRGRRLDRAVAELVAAAARSGALRPGGLVVATVVPRRRGADVATLKEWARAGARAGIGSARGRATLVVGTATAADLAAARAAGLPLGRHLALAAARRAGASPSPALTIPEILRQAGLAVGQALPGTAELVGAPDGDRPEGRSPGGPPGGRGPANPDVILPLPPGVVPPGAPGAGTTSATPSAGPAAPGSGGALPAPEAGGGSGGAVAAPESGGGPPGAAPRYQPPPAGREEAALDLLTRLVPGITRAQARALWRAAGGDWQQVLTRLGVDPAAWAAALATLPQR